MRMFRIACLAATVVSLTACDDDKYAAILHESGAPSASALPTPAAVSAPVASAPAPPPKPKGPCPKDKTVTFTDAATEAVVRFQLGKPQGPIARSDLPRVKTLDITKTHADEVDMCLVSSCTGVKGLYFGSGPLDDVTPLK